MMYECMMSVTEQLASHQLGVLLRSWLDSFLLLQHAWYHVQSFTITLRQRWRDSLVRMKVHPPSSLPLFVDLLPRYAPDY
mmetsp:Transcript_26477/g.67782  ORF Transcript_26477/g.67782 Transcript_26477/m.67782 type:complete len:80 (-) Transcript_26477:1710-1949(-)